MRITGLIVAAGAAALALLTAAPAAATPPPSPDPLTAVPGCERGCSVVFVRELPDDVRLAGLRTTDVATGPRRSYVAYWIGDRLHAVAEPERQATVRDGACGYGEGDAQRCAVSFTVGAHGSSVVSMLLTGDRGIEVTDRVRAGTPDAVIADLNGDGRPDAVLRQGSDAPDHSAPPWYWETWSERNGTFVRTGCTAPGHGREAAPRKPVYGHCP
ncbi:hypothetical protein [Pseudonocardia sp. H11422]|uniref:hypothetical protein n=1 Tax=Pseudonocardia sp. H11422 TaxID=2835866 RepID=UPI001BDC0141|nr:hypothetical protein [Pseudonocardia sp. H11422]